MFANDGSGGSQLSNLVSAQTGSSASAVPDAFTAADASKLSVFTSDPAFNNAPDDGIQHAFPTSSKKTFKNWYQIFPYQLVVRSNTEAIEYIYTLPIPPESLSIQMIPASEATATLGGVIEETSPTTFWNIQLAGTTGIAVGRPDGEVPDDGTGINTYRDKLNKVGLLGGALATAQNVLALATNLNDSISSIGKNGLSLDGAIDALSSVFSTSLPYSRSGVKSKDEKDKELTNGFTEIHRLHRFLYEYSIAKGLNPNGYTLHFKNWKDNTQWQCVVKGFSIQKSAANPYLYRYQFSLKGWDLTEPDGNTVVPVDRFGPGGDLYGISTLNVASSISRARDIKKQFNRIKSIFSKG